MGWNLFDVIWLNGLMWTVTARIWTSPMRYELTKYDGEKLTNSLPDVGERVYVHTGPVDGLILPNFGTPPVQP